MRIGIVPFLDPTMGGVYQYSLAVLIALQESVKRGMSHDFVVFTDQKHHVSLSGLDRTHWSVRPLEPVSFLDPFRRFVGEGPHRELWRSMRRRLSGKIHAVAEGSVTPHYDPDVVSFDPVMQRWFCRFGVDMMLYSGPIGYPLAASVPFILPMHDIQHRVSPEFPEVSANGEWDYREYFYRNGARYATLLVADSEIGQQDILRYYGEFGVTPDRIKVLPFQPAFSVSDESAKQAGQQVRASYALPDKFMFYPAQFWPHKNHANLVRALSRIKKQNGLTIPLVLCGSHSGELREQTFSEVMALAKDCHVNEQIHYLGYVKDDEMVGLYKEATALVMPTFFGPTNIPVVEAWALGCPVLTSDLRGIREHVGDAGLLADPRSAESLSHAMTRLWTDQDLCQDLIQRGKQRQASYSLEEFRQRLEAIVEEGVLRVQQGFCPKFSMGSK